MRILPFSIANGNGFGTVIDERLPRDQQPVIDEIRPVEVSTRILLALAPFVRVGDNDQGSALTGARWMAGLLVVSLVLTSFLLGGAGAATLAAMVTYFWPASSLHAW